MRLENYFNLRFWAFIMLVLEDDRMLSEEGLRIRENIESNTYNMPKDVKVKTKVMLRAILREPNKSQISLQNSQNDK